MPKGETLNFINLQKNIDISPKMIYPAFKIKITTTT